MNTRDLEKQLAAKKRSIGDLSRFISTRTDNNPNFTLLLGAGCSISSGVRSATELTSQWRRELCPSNLSEIEEQRRYLKDNCGEWYDPTKEYSSLFEKRFDLQRQRRMFVEREVSSKTPSLGYAYLISLVKQNYFDTIFTTNFDDLVNEAFYLYSDQRPIVCAHDSSINSVTVTSERPKIIKLHGDYLFDDLKSTMRETESLEQNMRAKFSEFARDYGLIVVGYAGGDRSIMDCILALLKNEEYFKGGIYWCLRPDTEISEELRKLLWKERTYFVEIEGFDELFAELYAGFNDGEVMPFSTSSVTRRPSQIVERLISDQSALKTNSAILKKAGDQLIRRSKRSALMDLISHPEKEEFLHGSREKFSDDELITQSEIQNLNSSGHYREAVAKGRAALESLGHAAKRGVLGLIVTAHARLDERQEAIATIDELIALEPYSPSHYLRKSEFVPKFEHKISEVDRAMGVHPFFVRSYERKARLYLSEAQNRYGDERAGCYSAAHKNAEKGLSLDPSAGNACWSALFDTIKEGERDQSRRKNLLREIVDRLSKMNPRNYGLLDMRLYLLDREDDVAIVDRFLSDLKDCNLRNSPEIWVDFDELRLQAIGKCKPAVDVIGAIAEAEEAYDMSKNQDLAVIVAKLKRKILGQDKEAIQVLREALKGDFHGAAVQTLFDALIDIRQLEEAEELLNRWSMRLTRRVRIRMRVDLLSEQGKFDNAIAELTKEDAQSKGDVDVLLPYFLIKKGAFHDAEKVARERLAAISFSPDATILIVNFELACRKNKGKANEGRLEKTLAFAENNRTKAAIYALLGKKRELEEAVKKEMALDRTFRFEFSRWPVFENFRDDQDLKNIVEALPKGDPLSRPAIVAAG